MNIEIRIESLIMCCNHVSKDESREVLQCICLENEKAIATNGRSIVVCNDTLIKIENDKKVLIKINKTDLTKLKKSMTGIIYIDTEKQTAITIPKNKKDSIIKVFIETTDLQYPNWQQVIPKDEAYEKSEGVKEIGLNSELLSLFPGTHKIEFANKKHIPVKLTPLHDATKNYTGYVMPCKTEV